MIIRHDYSSPAWHRCLYGDRRACKLDAGALSGRGIDGRAGRLAGAAAGLAAGAGFGNRRRRLGLAFVTMFAMLPDCRLAGFLSVLRTLCLLRALAALCIGLQLLESTLRTAEVAATQCLA
jgi:hypothetical protein